MSLSRRSALSLLAATVAVASGFAPAVADTPASTPATNGLRRALTPEDLTINRNCINKTLTEAPTGKTWDWKNPKSGNHGTVTPTTNPERVAGRMCRSFRETITLKNGRSQTINGRACQNRDGSWDMIG